MKFKKNFTGCLRIKDQARWNTDNEILSTSFFVEKNELRNNERLYLQNYSILNDGLPRQWTLKLVWLADQCSPSLAGGWLIALLQSNYFPSLSLLFQLENGINRCALVFEDIRQRGFTSNVCSNWFSFGILIKNKTTKTKNLTIKNGCSVTSHWRIMS